MSSSTLKVFVTRRIQEEVLLFLKKYCLISQWDSDLPISRKGLIEGIAGANGLLCLLTDKIDEEVIAAAGPSLKVISTMSVGFDHIDVAYCQSHGIQVGYTPGVLTEATAELTVALLLAVSRKIIQGAEAVKDGSWGAWSPMWMCGCGLKGSTVGIIGLGRIGRAVARRIQAFSPAYILYTRRGTTPSNDIQEAEEKLGVLRVSFEEILKRSDFLLICCSASKENEHLLNEESLGRVKPGCILINTSRGSLIHQEALVKALQHGPLAAAGLDVCTPEPLPTNHPLLQLPNCLVLPHIGSATSQTRLDMALLAARNLVAGLNGGPMPSPLKLLK